MNINISSSQENIIHNCLLDLLESSSSNHSSFLLKALQSLLHSQEFGIEMSGIYISTDADRENIPTYLTTGIAFEFMDNHVTLPFRDAIACITNWYNHHDNIRNPELDKIIEYLKIKFLQHGI